MKNLKKVLQKMLKSQEKRAKSNFCNCICLEYRCSVFNRLICVTSGELRLNQAFMYLAAETSSKHQVFTTYTGDFLLKVYRNEIPPIYMEILNEEIKELQLHPTYKSDTKRGILRVLHLGCWRKSSLDIFITADIKHNTATRFKAIEKIVEKVDVLFSSDFPQLFQFYNSLQLPHRYFKSFATCAVNMLLNSNGISLHKDEDDFKNGLCWVVPFGSYSGGNCIFKDLQLEIEIRPGDVLCFKSFQLEHGCTAFSGYRGSLVFFTGNPTFFPPKIQ